MQAEEIPQLEETLQRFADCQTVGEQGLPTHNLLKLRKSNITATSVTSEMSLQREEPQSPPTTMVCVLFQCRLW